LDEYDYNPGDDDDDDEDDNQEVNGVQGYNSNMDDFLRRFGSMCLSK